MYKDIIIYFLVFALGVVVGRIATAIQFSLKIKDLIKRVRANEAKKHEELLKKAKISTNKSKISDKKPSKSPKN